MIKTIELDEEEIKKAIEIYINKELRCGEKARNKPAVEIFIDEDTNDLTARMEVN